MRLRDGKGLVKGYKGLWLAASGFEGCTGEAARGTAAFCLHHRDPYAKAIAGLHKVVNLRKSHEVVNMNTGV